MSSLPRPIRRTARYVGPTYRNLAKFATVPISLRNQAAIKIDDIRDFFSLVLAKNAVALDLISQADSDLQLLPQGFVFSLPALHAILDPNQCLPYRDFRNLLYDSTLNQELSAFDAEVVLFQSTGKVDTSLYCLRQIPNA